MTTNYKTSFLLPHDYEIPTFNYPQYVLPPVPYNYSEYTKDIMPAGVVQTLKTKITAPAQCKWKNNPRSYINLFSDEFNEAYYEIEIDLKQIDPTIQSISKFQDAYKTIEISNLGNLQVECGPPEIENFIPNRNINLIAGANSCDVGGGSLANITLQQSGRSQTDKVNFPNTFKIDTKKITNDIQTFEPIAHTNGLPGGNYKNNYLSEKNHWDINFLLKITKLSNNDNNKIRETYIQAYYTNDVKLKIRFTKIVFAELFSGFGWIYFGNDKNITIDVSNPNVLGIRNKSDYPIKITIKPR